MLRPLTGPRRIVVFGVIAALAFGVGEGVVRLLHGPLGWLEDAREPLLEPLAEDRLSLGDLARQAPGELWLQREQHGPLLVYRSELPGGHRVDMEAELAWTDTQGLGPEGDPPQRLAGAEVESLADEPVSALTLTPASPVATARLVASLGQPRLRYQLETAQGWFYPEHGLTAHIRNGELYRLRVVPLGKLRGR